MSVEKFPGWRYAKDGRSALCPTAQHAADLGPGWAESPDGPFEIPTPAAPELMPDAADLEPVPVKRGRRAKE